jgi:epoxide hydrolase-like predicted phosphatase
MIKAVIFDCFGVLTTDRWLPFKKKYFGHDQKLLQEASDLNSQANSKLISYDNFLSAIAKMARLTPAEVKSGIESTNTAPNDELFEYIKKIKASYKIGMLSNASSNRLSELFTQSQLDLFDKIVLSYQIGIPKPDPRAYKLAAEQLGVSPNESIFIDDQEKHLYGAREVGMHDILYEDFSSFKQKIEKILAAVADN